MGNSSSHVVQYKGVIMRSVIYGTLITVFLANAGTVQGANDLDGKAVLCSTWSKISNSVYGLVFEAGKVTRWQTKGYSKAWGFSPRKYDLKGSTEVTWFNFRPFYLNRKTLQTDDAQCKISSKKEIFQKLDEIIATAKKKNKL